MINIYCFFFTRISVYHKKATNQQNYSEQITLLIASVFAVIPAAPGIAGRRFPVSQTPEFTTSLRDPQHPLLKQTCWDCIIPAMFFVRSVHKSQSCIVFFCFVLSKSAMLITKAHLFPVDACDFQTFGSVGCHDDMLLTIGHFLI